MSARDEAAVEKLLAALEHPAGFDAEANAAAHRELASLGLAAEPQTPPAKLRRQLLARVSARPRLRATRRFSLALALAASLVLALGLVVLAFERHRLIGQRAELAQRIDANQSEHAALARDLAAAAAHESAMATSAEVLRAEVATLRERLEQTRNERLAADTRHAQTLALAETARQQAEDRANEWQRQGADLERKLAVAEQQLQALDGLRHEREQLEQKLVAATTRMAVLEALRHSIASATVDRFQLAGTEAQPEAKLTLLWDREAARWQLVGSNLAPPPEGRVYALWALTTDQQAVPAGTFVPDGTGAVVHQVAVPVGLNPESIAMAAVSDEPPGGSPQPTGAVRLVGTL